MVKSKYEASQAPHARIATVGILRDDTLNKPPRKPPGMGTEAVRPKLPRFSPPPLLSLWRYFL